MAPPTVTVVIPSSGRWHFLHRALQAVQLQEGVQARAVIVVNGPNAQATDELERLRARGAEVLVGDVPSVSGARNDGLRVADGDWVALLDDDDVWAPSKLAAQVDAATASDADFAYSAVAIVGSELRLRWTESAPDPRALAEQLALTNPIPACASNLLVRTALAQSTGFRDDLRHFADWDFAARLVLAAEGAGCPDTHVGYVWHPGGLHATEMEVLEAEFGHFAATHPLGAGGLGSDIRRYRWTASSYRETGQRTKAARAYLRGARRHRSPGDVGRAFAVLLGERAMARGRRRTASEPQPPWLQLYR